MSTSTATPRRISPEAPVPILKVTQTESRCGGAGSVAADLAALGAVPVCIGVVGEDANGAVLKERLTALGADTSGLYAVADRPTTTKQRLIGLAQHRHQQQLMRIDQESTEALADGVYDRLLQAYREALEQVEIVCLQDYHKGVLTDEMCKEMIRLGIEAGRKVLVDPVLSRDYAKYAGATLLTPNRYETSTGGRFRRARCGGCGQGRSGPARYAPTRRRGRHAGPGRPVSVHGQHQPIDPRPAAQRL